MPELCQLFSCSSPLYECVFMIYCFSLPLSLPRVCACGHHASRFNIAWFAARKGDGKMYFQWDAGSNGKKQWRYYSNEVLS